ncbi:hypothetical protein CHK_0148 [Christensenella hongkongensis]|uniref:Uncharacterized protein n=1 Tax=Christensenella hongkongensis TaxID=270498 RepID=A0A0M2NJM6_9FIRM|nr:hypothetical protein CHK_0148 [Christensenella hongkongensis]
MDFTAYQLMASQGCAAVCSLHSSAETGRRLVSGFCFW